MQDRLNYAASKAGVIGLTKSAARELASRKITVNAVAPGFIETDMTKVLSEKVKEDTIAKIPLGSYGKPEDIASAVLPYFLHRKTQVILPGRCSMLTAEW